MKSTFAIALTTVLTLVSGINKPAFAYNSTQSVASIYCNQIQKAILTQPQYAGQARNGLDLWVCVETGYSRNSFVMLDPGPYAVLMCNQVECALVEWTY